jgi:hypothetical protein
MTRHAGATEVCAAGLPRPWAPVDELLVVLVNIGSGCTLA